MIPQVPIRMNLVVIREKKANAMERDLEGEKPINLI